ncbi:MAG: hypothetical protein ACAH80_18745 [Alphaproteobacteria bacterium]
MADATNLEEVRQKLYKAFNKAMKGVEYWEADSASEIERHAAASAAAANSAQAITTVEREIAVLQLLKEAKESGAGITIEIDKGLARSVSVPSPIKLKQG